MFFDYIYTQTPLGLQVLNLINQYNLDVNMHPNHHVFLDYAAIKLDIKKLEGVKKIYIDYHDQFIWRKA